MGQILLPIRILDIQVVAIFGNLLRRNLPGPFALSPILPPGQAIYKLFILQGLSFRVGLPALRQWLLIVPDFLCRPGAVEDSRFVGMPV